MSEIVDHDNGDMSFEVEGRMLRVAWSERGKTYHDDGWDLADIPLYLDGAAIEPYAMAVNQEGVNDVLQGSRVVVNNHLYFERLAHAKRGA